MSTDGELMGVTGQGAVWVVANAAGSAGKTTTAVTMAGLLADEHGLRVRVIDLDPQGNASTWLGVENPTLTTGDVLLRRASLDEATVKTVEPNVVLVPASQALHAAGLELGNVTVGREMRLRSALVASTREIDVTIIDCAGTLTLLSVVALTAATGVITVTMPSAKEIEGIPALEATVSDVAEAYAPGLEVLAVVPCRVPPPNAGRLYGVNVEFLEERWPSTVTPRVRQSVKVPDAYDAQLPLHRSAPSAPVTDDYRAVTLEILARDPRVRHLRVAT